MFIYFIDCILIIFCKNNSFPRQVSSMVIKKKFQYLIRNKIVDAILKHPGMKCTSEDSSCMKAGIEAFVSARKYQMKPQCPSWYCSTCWAGITHREQYYTWVTYPILTDFLLSLIIMWTKIVLKGIYKILIQRHS